MIWLMKEGEKERGGEGDRTEAGGRIPRGKKRNRAGLGTGLWLSVLSIKSLIKPKIKQFILKERTRRRQRRQSRKPFGVAILQHFTISIKISNQCQFIMEAGKAGRGRPQKVAPSSGKCQGNAKATLSWGAAQQRGRQRGREGERGRRRWHF